MNAILSALRHIGALTIDGIWRLGFITRFLFAVLMHSGQSLRRIHLTIRELYFSGVLSLLIIMVSGSFVGLVLGLQGYEILQRFGSTEALGTLVALSLTRELGPVLCGVVLAGRVGAAITAEIGTMRVTEQIDALRCLAVSPVGYLVVPRLVACMTMLPLLTVFGVTIGVGGGMIVASLTHGVSSYTFMHSIHVYCVPSDLYIGVFKSVIFGMIVALVGCDRGMTCTAGAEGVGKATTQSVVYSIIMLFAANYLLSSILF